MSELPSWEGFNSIVLRVLLDGQTMTLRELRDNVMGETHLSEAQRSVSLPSGQSMADNRIGWAVSYLNRVGALERPRRGEYRITQIGRNLLQSHPNGIVEKDLRKIAKPDDHWWLPKKVTGTLREAVDKNITMTPGVARLDPIEQIEEGVSQINDEVASNLLSRLQEGEPAFFEKTVVSLLIAMGYGGAHGKGTVTQLTNDEGIDGVIDQDALGLNKVYVQAKRYSSTNSVQRPEVQSFVGALSGKADGGLFITTGKFTNGATDYARGVPSRIILIDGQQLTTLMIRYGVGVETKQTYNIVGIDEDFFA